MVRRRHDWIQLALLLLTMVGIAVHVESRIARVEQHLTDQDRALEVINGRLQSLDPTARAGPR